jgi:hypothetical protein
MTQEDIIRMNTVTELWQQSQNDAEGMRLGYTTQQHYFAALVAAAEREACAKVCESYLSESPHSWGGTTMAAAIRERGQA